MENKKVAPEELTAYFGSKLDMYNVLSVDRKHHNNQQIYSRVLSAPYLACYTKFLRDVWSKKKKMKSLLFIFPKVTFTSGSAIQICQVYLCAKISRTGGE